MKKRLFSILLALCMVLCLVPTTAFAEGKTEETPVCTCETACAEETMNAECPVCGADGALAENCGKYAAEESGQTGTSNDAPAITAADVQALIDALPEAETISEDNAADVEVQLEAIDEAKVQLSDEDFAVLDFTRYDAAVAVLMALSGEPGATFVPQAASSHTHCICGGENTVGDHTAHQAADYQPWNGSDAISYTDGKAYVYLTDNATINTNLVVDGTTLYLCLNGKEYASNGTNKIQVKNSGRLVLCDCKGTGVIKGATSGWGGMGIYLYAGTVDIFGGKFTGGKVTGNGGGGAIALEDNSSTLNIYDGEISGNNGNGKGGAIYTKSGGTINMYGGRIAKNEAYRGGGLCLTGGSTFNMYGGLLENNSSTARWDTIPANSGNLYIAGGAVMNANAGVVRGGGYAVFNLGTLQTDDANYPATKFYSGLYNMGGVVKGGMYYGSYMSAGGNLGGCEVNYTLADSNLASYHYAWQFIEPGNTPTRPDDPTKTGYLFDGWYVGENAFDFSVPVTESVRVVAKWSKCDHTGSTAQPTCTDSAVCTVCGGTIPEKGHALIWQSENGEYWQKCSNCDFETEKKPIPALTLNAPDKVCRTQDCTFTFNLPNGCKLIITGYEFEKIGGDLSATLENGKYTVELGSSSYPAEENGFKITVSAETADGFAIKAEKSVMILNDHTGGTATCTAKAVCEVCKAEYGEKLPHDFTAETVDAKYLKSAATCTEKAVYYKSCAVCGLSSEGTADEATFFSGNALDHDWGAWTQNSDEKTHTRICKRDTSHTETENCHGGTATCTAKAVCTVCGGEYGEMAAHSFTAEKAEAQYLKSAATCTEKAIYYKSCAVCGLSSEGTADEATFFSGNALDHDWGAWTQNSDEKTHTRICKRDTSHTETENCIDANKDHKCDICDYIISECADDNKDHKCDYCGKKLTEHTGGKATCKDKAKCEVCGAEYGEIDAKNHTNLKHFPATAATKTTEGNIEYWYCDGCGKYYSDKDGTKEIKKADTVTTKLKDDSKLPQTSDTSNLALWIALLFISGGAAIGTTVVSRKKKYNR